LTVLLRLFIFLLFFHLIQIKLIRNNRF
jgi:hypothetical protein